MKGQAVTSRSTDALPELAETDVSGDLARIYREIREFCAVPYVSSLQRHLATRRGWLEWCWAAVRPAYADGRAQEAAWAAARTVTPPALAVIPRPALRVLGVDADGERTIRNLCQSFVRVSPTNLAFSGIVRRILAGERGRDEGTPRPGWVPPQALDPMPSLADPSSLDPDAREALRCFETLVDGHPFVPGLYRMLAHWPGLLAHLAVVLAPHLHDERTQARCRALAAAVDESAGPVLASLPPLAADPPMPPADEHPAVLDAMARYRITSPEMVLFGTMILDALPPRED